MRGRNAPLETVFRPIPSFFSPSMFALQNLKTLEFIGKMLLFIFAFWTTFPPNDTFSAPLAHLHLKAAKVGKKCITTDNSFTADGRVTHPDNPYPFIKGWRLTPSIRKEPEGKNFENLAEGKHVRFVRRFLRRLKISLLLDFRDYFWISSKSSRKIAFF